MAPSKKKTPEGARLPALLLPVALAALIGLLGLSTRVQASVVLTRSFHTAAAFLVLWTVALLAVGRTRGTPPVLNVSLRAQHYIQACCQLAVFAYWGWYWRPVYDMAVRPDGSARWPQASSQARAAGVLQAMLGPSGTQRAAASPGKWDSKIER